jgi:hypothetical protein
MSSDSSAGTQMADAIDPCTTSGSCPPRPSTLDPTSQSMSPMPSLRVRTLAPLLNRENVKAILGLSGVKSITVTVRFADDTSDSKAIALAEGGSLAMVLLDDNPDGIPSGAFCDIRPA